MLPLFYRFTSGKTRTRTPSDQCITTRRTARPRQSLICHHPTTRKPTSSCVMDVADKKWKDAVKEMPPRRSLKRKIIGAIRGHMMTAWPRKRSRDTTSLRSLIHLTGLVIQMNTSLISSIQPNFRHNALISLNMKSCLSSCSLARSEGTLSAGSPD